MKMSLELKDGGVMHLDGTMAWDRQEGRYALVVGKQNGQLAVVTDLKFLPVERFDFDRRPPSMVSEREFEFPSKKSDTTYGWLDPMRDWLDPMRPHLGY